jgi:hypothetical protein
VHTKWHHLVCDVQECGDLFLKLYEEIAGILGVNQKTVRRHWALAKVGLYRAIRHDE